MSSSRSSLSSIIKSILFNVYSFSFFLYLSYESDTLLFFLPSPNDYEILMSVASSSLSKISVVSIPLFDDF